MRSHQPYDHALSRPLQIATDNPSGEPVLGIEGIWLSLERLGIDVVFGAHNRQSHVLSALPSAARRWIYVQIAHEADAANAAIGYARATGRTGVCISISDSGATSLATALASAQRDSIPFVALSLRPSDDAERFHDRNVDIVGVTMPITKHNFAVTDPTDIPTVLSEAFHIASTGRPGAVLIDILNHVLLRQMTFSWPENVRIPGYRPRAVPHRKQVLIAANKIARARSPVVCVGGGVVAAGAAAELLEFVELTGIPVVSTETARGMLPDSHRLSYGMLGGAGTAAASAALDGCDVIIALGVRFDRSLTGDLEVFAPNADLVHIDIDPEEIGRHQIAQVSIVGDCKLTLAALCAALREEFCTLARPELSEWRAHLDAAVSTGRGADADVSEEALLEATLRGIGQRAENGAIFVCGEGPHRPMAANLPRFDKPRLWLGSGAEQGLGSSLAVAIGAQIGAPCSQVWVLETGASLLASLHALVAAVELGLPIKIMIVSATFDRGAPALGSPASEEDFAPDLLRVARSLGCVAVDGAENSLLSALDSALAVPDRPVAVDLSLRSAT